MWEFYENNFLLGKWCEFNIFSNKKIREEIPTDINIIKNTYHWNDYEKKVRDHEYLNKKIEYLFEIISEKLSEIHNININENKEYWRIIFYNWLSEYSVTVFDRWENIRIFFEKNKTEKFYSNFILLNDQDYVPRNHTNFMQTAKTDEWNHLIYLRLFSFLNIPNLSLIEKKIINKYSEKRTFSRVEKIPLRIQVVKFIDNVISKFAFKFNGIIFENFHFPKKEYLKICLRNKLIPSKYTNLFNFDVKDSKSERDDKRTKLKNLLFKIDSQDKFIKFLLLNIHKDLPKSYLENFDLIKKKILPLAKNKKIIFSMHTIDLNDNFKIYLAETKKVGSKYKHSRHGGGLTFKTSMFDNMIEKVSDKLIVWGDSYSNKNPYVKLSPTLPIIKLKKSKAGNYCSIIFVDCLKYQRKFNMGPTLEQKIDFFNELTQFVNQLNPEIKSKVKFRAKKNLGSNFEKKFSETFGAKYIDKISYKNSYKKSLLNSKLIIATYPETIFSEAMYSNTPTILIIKKKQMLLSKDSLDDFDYLKKNKIAFEDFQEAKNHINKYWNELDIWWKSKNVQTAREMFLTNYFKVKFDWYKNWSEYIYSSKEF